jgi:di/tricarboxylate transporter
MWLVLSLAGFALAVVLHALLTRMGGSLTIVLGFLFVSVPLAIVIAALALWMFALSDESIATLLVYLALCETYIFLFTLAANGVSVSLMMRLRVRPTTADELMRSYSTRAMVERRIDHLTAGGFLTETGGQIRLLQRGAALVRVFALARAFFKHRRALETGGAQDGASGQRAQS